MARTFLSSPVYGGSADEVGEGGKCCTVPLHVAYATHLPRKRGRKT